jgi:uncharacterized membrane protein YbhN (UPF0104 family)
MRRAAALASLAAFAAAGGAAARIAPGSASTVLEGVRGAAPLPLLLAAGCYALSLTCAAASWRPLLRACGGRTGLAGVCARYAAGSLANTLLPARAGDALRIGLFARTLPAGSSRLLLVAGVATATGVVRWTGVAALAAASAAGSLVSPLAVPIAGAAALLPLLVAAALARRGSTRATALLTPLRSASAGERATAAACVAATLAARVAAAALVANAFSLPHPLAAAMLAIPTLELAGIVPLTPANLGVAGGAAAVAFHLQGAPSTSALAAGLTLHALETATSIGYGAVAAGLLGLHDRRTEAVVIDLPLRAAALREAA